MSISRLGEFRIISRMICTACLHPLPVCNSCMPVSSLAAPSAAAAAAAVLKAPGRVQAACLATSFPGSHQIHRSLHTSCASLQQEDIPTAFSVGSASTSSLSPSSLPNPGHIELVIGPMFAGKSNELLRRVSYYESQGLTVAIVKSNKDDRYSASHVVTHDGFKKECHAVPSLTAFRETWMTLYTAADVIAIDEAQFFPDLKEFCTFAADHDDKRLVLAGLDGDFLRRKFGQVLDLVPLADKVTKLTAICRYCQQEEEEEGENGNSKNSSSTSDGNNANNNGKNGAHLVDESSRYPAAFSLRISAESGTEQEVVGGADTYAPVCRKHYVRFSQMGKKGELGS